MKENFIYFFKMWGALLVVGAIFFPISSLIFKKFDDKGWMFSKLLGFGITGLAMFILSYMKVLKFSTVNCYILLAIVLALDMFFMIKKKRANELKFDFNLIFKNILITEIVFCVAFMTWTYIRSFEVSIDNTTEQFMNYGFMNKIMMTDYMPPEDIWLSGNSINYYYFGQYISAFLTKLSFLNVSEGYNIMLALVASLTFMLPYSIAFNLGKNLVKMRSDNKENKNTIIPYVVAIITGLSICIGGTLYYPLYKNAEKEDGQPYYYWDATRYIGYRPETNDKTITEIPSYSNIAGDLHAHFTDTMFVFTMIALILALMLKDKEEHNKKRLLSFNVCILGVVLGIQKMTNYWDFPIYLVVIAVALIANNIVKYKLTKKNIFITIAQLLEIVVLEELVTMPFSRDLYISATNVEFTHVTSPFYKLLVLWGLPTVCFIANLVFVLIKIFKDKKNALIDKIRSMNMCDIFIILIGMCALGLVIIPEIIYLKDIYSDEYKRANTMFKLTYQAYILFSISTSYIIVKFISEKDIKIKKYIGIVLLIAQLSTFGYGINAIEYELKNYTRSDMKDAESYIYNYYPDDYDAIQWIKANVDSDEVILESVDGSYTISSRISVFTGNPTVLGWHGHEWIWRAENYLPPEQENERWQEINTIFYSEDTEYIKSILEKYNVSYIYLGNVEYEKGYNFDVLRTMGEVVYDNEDGYYVNPVYLIKVK